MSAPATEGKAPPTVYLFYGDDPFGMAEAVQSLQSKFSDPASADMNTERFNGAQLNWGQLEEVAASAPFLADRRLLIVEEAAKLVSRKDDRERAFSLFEQVAPTTRLVLLDMISLNKRSALENYRKRSHLFRWTSDHPDQSYHQAFTQPTGAAFVQWIRQRVNEADGEIETAAAQLLAEAVNDDLYLADQEVEKLVTYVDSSRSIQPEDVERLTPLYRQSDIFAMVDAVGARDARAASRHLHRLLQDDDPRYAFAMIARQFRLMLQASEALANGKDPKQALSIHPYVAGKVTNQARNFKLAQLEAIIHRLYQLDLDSKTGRADLTTELDQLITQLAR